jgi:hypothetical protein
MMFDLERHRGERLRRLETENEFLRAERRRLEKVLAAALLVAAGSECQPAALLDVLIDYCGLSAGSMRPAAPQCLDTTSRNVSIDCPRRPGIASRA